MLRSREAELQRLDTEAERLREAVERRDREVASLHAQLDLARDRTGEEFRGIALLGRRLEEMTVSARGQATRIRLQALREAAELNARSLVASEEVAPERREAVLGALEAAIERVAGEWDDAAPAPISIPADLDAAEFQVTRLAEGGEDADEASPRAEAESKGGVRVASRSRVSVDVGPFADFSQLVRFEDAANSIGATGDISIKRFSEGRARIDVALSEPVDLLRELEQRCDLEFEVRSRDEHEIVLDFA